MKNKKLFIILTRFVFFLILGGITFFIIWMSNKHFGDEFWNAFIISISVELVLIASSTFYSLIKSAFKEIENVRPYYYDSKFNNEKIRLSFAYLIRIKVNNKYLLVKSGHKREVFVPVGGVYHIEHIDYVYKTLGFSRDSHPGDDQDIRGTILGKNIKKFIKWFDQKKNRETTPNREFQEELLTPGLVPNQLFDNPTFNFLGTKYKGISYSEFYNMNELLRFDIYELVLNEEQRKYLESGKLNGKYIKLFSREEIESLGVTGDNDKRTVGTQTPYILED